MIATPNEIIGSLVYRTAQALSNNALFMKEIKKHRFYPTLVNDNKLHLWNYPGTMQEISQTFMYLSKDSVLGGKLKFPAVLNYQGVFVRHESRPGVTTMMYNLAIVSPVLSDWTTQQREEQTYKLVLKPIEDEFIRQIEEHQYFQLPLGKFSYGSAYVPTTGDALNSTMKMKYGDFIDAIEFPGLSISVMSNICESECMKIHEESEKVTDEIKNLKI
jgi:hypothetical protein